MKRIPVIFFLMLLALSGLFSGTGLKSQGNGHSASFQHRIRPASVFFASRESGDWHFDNCSALAEENEVDEEEDGSQEQHKKQPSFLSFYLPGTGRLPNEIPGETLHTKYFAASYSSLPVYLSLRTLRI